MPQNCPAETSSFRIGNELLALPMGMSLAFESSLRWTSSKGGRKNVDREQHENPQSNLICVEAVRVTKDNLRTTDEGSNLSRIEEKI